MNKVSKKFKIFVILFVMLTGLAFSTYTGLIYSGLSGRIIWVFATIVGTISSYFLARLYIKLLLRISAKYTNKAAIWLLGSLVGVLCGVICTTLTHGVMLAATKIFSASEEYELFGMFILGIGELVGAGAGLAVGAICSLIYIVILAREKRETN